MPISIHSSSPRKSIGYNTEQEIDNRIASIEFQLCTESVPLKAKAFRVVSTEGRTRNNIIFKICSWWADVSLRFIDSLHSFW